MIKINKKKVIERAKPQVILVYNPMKQQVHLLAVIVVFHNVKLSGKDLDRGLMV